MCLKGFVGQVLGLEVVFRVTDLGSLKKKWGSSVDLSLRLTLFELGGWVVAQKIRAAAATTEKMML